MFLFLRKITRNDNLIFSLISLIYLPGTIIHEFGHFIMAMILFLKVTDISIFPEWKDNYIKLGSVLYEKKDYLRSILVGIAPLFSGLFFFFFIAYFNLLPSENILINFFLFYLMFAVSSTMFSSKQDLKDVIFVIPFVVVIVGIVYILGIDIRGLFNHQGMLILTSFSQQINLYLFISLLINLSLVILLNFFNLFAK